VGAAVVLTFGLLSIFHTAGASGSVERTATVEVGTVDESQSASGNISPADSANVNFVNGGTLTAVDVSVGQSVKAGELLAKIDPTEADDNLQGAQDSLQVAQTALGQAEAGGTTSQLDQNQASMSTSQLQLTSDEQQLSTDQTNLTDAQAALASDKELGCPAGSSADQSSSDQSSSSGNSGTSGNSGSGEGSELTGETGSTTTTTQSAPVATTGSAADVATTTVTLSASVNPGGLSTSYLFEYGPTDAYGHDTASQAVSGSEAQTVTAQVSGLSPDAGYIFRVVASNSHGSDVGLGVAFTTAQSSCTSEQQTVTSDQQTVAHDEGELSAQEESIAATEASEAPNSSTILQDESQVLQDQETVTTDGKTASETTLVAPISGTVTAVNDQVGDTVSGGGSSADSSSSSSSSGGSSSSTGSTNAATNSNTSSSDSSSSSSSSSSGFMTIETLSSLQVVAGFAEADATSLAVGQGATVTLAALTDTEVAGKVVAISPTPTVVSDVVTYDVTIDLINPPSTVKDGMTADVNVIVDIAHNVLEVPNAAISTVGNTSTVQLVQNGTTVTKEVTTGLVGESDTQIINGLTAGQKVQEASTTSTGSTGTSTSTGGFGGGGGGGGFGGGGFGGGGFGG
jgi:multidrug efflux pump subunit AcrA (membrane-fusion protein)